MAIALALLALTASGAVSLKAERASVRAADPAAVGLEVKVTSASGAPISGAEVTLTTNVGQVSAARKIAPGQLQATFHAPKERYPQIAILAADVVVQGKWERAWTAIPILGVETLKLSTKPNAKVEVRVGDRVFGPVQANPKGEAAVPIEAPPGQPVARVTSVDKLGNRKEKTLPLNPPPFARLRLLPAGPEAAASWAEAPLGLEVLVVDPAGRPATSPALSLTASAGTVSPASVVAAGRATATFRAPESVGDGTARLRVSLLGSGGSSELLVRLRPGPPAQVRLGARPPEIRAGSPPIELDAQGVDAKGNPVEVTPTLSASLGTVRPGPTPGRYVLELPQGWKGQSAVRVTAKAQEARGELVIPLAPGPAKSGIAKLRSRLVFPGEQPARVEVALEDASGNPASDAAVEAKSTVGRVGPVERVGPGRFAFDVQLPEGTPFGEGEVLAGPPNSPLKLRAPIDVLPVRRPWGVTLGAMLSAHSNFQGARGLTPLIDLGVRPGRFPLEGVFQLGVGVFAPIRRSFPDAGSDAVTVTSVLTESLTLGARTVIPVTLRLTLHGSAVVGVAFTQTRTHLENSATPNLNVTANATGLALRVAGGVGVRIGPGRLVAEVQWLHFPVKETAIFGNLGGFGVALGYLADLR